MSDNFDWKSYDFIEEGLCCSPEPLSFSEVSEGIISESKSINSGNRHIIGKISGCFQEVGGFSRNRRYYLPEHWKIQLDKPELQERLKSGDVLGTTGHFDRPVTDEDIREGRVSHIVRVLEIREDATGKPFLYGEMEILDTKAGRNLKALYEGGANLYVSSRAAGKLLDTPGKDYKTVDPVSFHFCTFDTVRRPGFLAAKPVYEEVLVDSKLHESVEGNDAPITENTSFLQDQIDKLTKIVEKVVENIDKTEEKIIKPSIGEAQANLIGALALLGEAKLSEAEMEEIVDEIKKGLK